MWGHSFRRAQACSLQPLKRTAARLSNAFRHAAVHNNNGERNEDAELTGTVRLFEIIPNKAELSYLQEERERLFVLKEKYKKYLQLRLS